MALDACYATLRNIHEIVRPARYVEIGVRHGGSLGQAFRDADAIAIDPEPEVLFPLPENHRVYAMTSDDFFASHDLREELGGHAFDLAFIDGMHRFEFALRDFINLEHAADPSSVVLVHDCLPVDEESASRERTTKLWSGDVWKLVCCLRDLRPDLHVTTFDVEPTGLGVITGLDPGSSLLGDRYDELVERFVPLTFAVAFAGGKEEALNVRHTSRDELQRVLSPSKRRTGSIKTRLQRLRRGSRQPS